MLSPGFAETCFSLPFPGLQKRPDLCCGPFFRPCTKNNCTAADFFCMNAAALFIAGIASDFRKAAGMALQALASGAAFRKLEELRAFQGKEEPCSV